MRRSLSVIIIFSILGCASVQRPDAQICMINAKGMKLRCYNVKEDYTDDGVLKPDSKPKEFQLKSINDLNAWVCMDPLSLEKFKVYMGDLKDWIKARCQ